MERFKNKYRIPSARLPNWDYANAGAYFITICTHNREHFFGKIVDGNMQRSELGDIVDSEWLKTFELRKDMNLEMGEYIVMPNHFHGVVIIGNNDFNRDATHRGDAMHRRDAMHCVSTTTNENTITKNKFAPQSKNLASIIRGFKSSVTTYARKNGINNFKWQSRFHDHIIRNEISFQKISNYIINNPANWVQDKFYI